MRRRPETRQGTEKTRALPAGAEAASSLPERLPWPAAMLVILGSSLLLWLAFGSVFGSMLGWW